MALGCEQTQRGAQLKFPGSVSRAGNRKMQLAASEALRAKTGTLRPWTHRMPENYFLKRKKHSHTRWVGRGSEHCSKHSSEPGSEPLRLHDCGDSSESGEDRVARGRVAPTPPLENHREKTKRFRS